MPTKTKKSRKPRAQAVIPRASKTARKAEVNLAANAAVLGKAMLVNVSITMWEGRKHDREVTAQVNAEFSAAHDAGRYHKDLFGGKIPERSTIITAAANLRGLHYNNTLPWADSGWRLLPTANYFEYMAKLREAMRRYNDAADAFASAYEGRVREAEGRLQQMFHEEDYPSADMVRRKYHVALEFSPLPASADFRISLPSEELARVASEVENRVHESLKLAIAEAWSRLGDAIVDVRSRLDDGKYLRESMIERLQNIAEVLGRLNLTDDPALETTRKEVLRQLTVFDVNHLRDDPKVRAVAAKRADDILKSMAGVYTPSPSTPKE